MLRGARLSRAETAETYLSGDAIVSKKKHLLWYLTSTQSKTAALAAVFASRENFAVRLSAYNLRRQ